MISRAQAEDLLQDQEIGSFLIRLSDKIWGYTISYKCEERIKHFLIDAMNFKKVKFDGNSEKMHKDLHALITFHEVKISINNVPCIQNWSSTPSDRRKADFGCTVCIAHVGTLCATK